MAWVHLGDVWAFDLNGSDYALLGRAYYESVQDITNNRTAMKVEAYKHRGTGSTRTDFDVRAWGVDVTAVGAATGSGRAQGSAAPNFTGMVAEQNVLLGTSSSFYITHKVDGTAQVSLVASWDATSAGSWFDAGFSGTAGPLTLPTIPRFGRVFNGTALVHPKSMRVYNGTALVPVKSMRVFNGSTLVPVK